MGLPQLVFRFVHATLFATFLLGMFWKRTTGHGAFTGLMAGTLAAWFTHSLTLADGKGGIFGVLRSFPSTMAQNFGIAISVWSTCFLVTVGVSLATRAKADSELEGLVWGLTKMPPAEGAAWYARLGLLAVAVGSGCVMLNIILW